MLITCVYLKEKKERKYIYKYIYKRKKQKKVMHDVAFVYFHSENLTYALHQSISVIILRNP